MLLKKIFKCSSQIKYEMLYHELGLLPVRFIIQLRRFLFLQHILKQRDEQTLMYRFSRAQMENPNKNDWVTSVLQDLEDANINMERFEIENISEDKLKNICKEKVKTMAYEYLMKIKEHRENPIEAKYDTLELAKYLQEDEGFSVKEKQDLFYCKMKDIDVKANRKYV